MDSVLVPLSVPGRAAVERIKAAGFADDDVGAIRVAVADMATRLGPMPSSHVMPAFPTSAPADPHASTPAPGRSDSRVAAAEALEIVRTGRCTCRIATGRHQLLTSLLDALSRHGTANWLEVLDQARESAAEYNRKVGLPPTQPPGGVAYNPAAMSQNWMRAYILGGAGKFKERYSPDGPGVATTSTATGRGVRIDLT